ncbi:unnamed protein product [Tuber aestivum]|uniref:V-SNARE coiled-coil homology domain-containing protein n=1 Tax=Tuber aestivum TaxID=59557 RepID=A0A292PRW5_9PEZI|nr:unnamed protein product [Tuber aestivum]
MRQFEAGGENEDVVAKAQREIESARGIMTENIERVLERRERIDLLVDKTAGLQSGPMEFRVRSRGLRRRMRWKNAKFTTGDGEQLRTLQVGNSMVNATYRLLLLAGGAETSAGLTKGAFQQLDVVSLLAPHTNIAVGLPKVEDLPRSIRHAYRFAFYGRLGVGFVDLPADYIGEPSELELAIYTALPYHGLRSAQSLSSFNSAALLPLRGIPLTLPLPMRTSYAPGHCVNPNRISKTPKHTSSIHDPNNREDLHETNSLVHRLITDVGALPARPGSWELQTCDRQS